MTRSRLLVVPALIALSVMLSGCGAGFFAATNRPYTPSNGTSMSVGTMDARNILLVADPTRPQTFTLIGALVNNGENPEALTAVTVQGAGTVALNPITVAAHSIITTGDQPTSLIEVPQATFGVGDFTNVTLTFASSGTVSRAVLAQTTEGVTAGG